MKRIPSFMIAAILLFWSTTLRPADLKPPPSAALLQLGKQIYAQQCVACHGPQGKADGEAAYLLYPKPRDFTAANYRLVSTWDRVPTDDDLFNTITRGMPGSAMPSWGQLHRGAALGARLLPEIALAEALGCEGAERAAARRQRR